MARWLRQAPTTNSQPCWWLASCFCHCLTAASCCLCQLLLSVATAAVCASCISVVAVFASCISVAVCGSCQLPARRLISCGCNGCNWAGAGYMTVVVSLESRWQLSYCPVIVSPKELRPFEKITGSEWSTASNHSFNKLFWRLYYFKASADSETAAVPKSHSLVCKNNQSRSGEDDIGGEPWGENIFMTFRLPTD